mgnify:CR=1 FL=1
MKKIGLIAALGVLSGIVIFPCFSERMTSAQGANRRTAIRYLQLAKQYASSRQWHEAEGQSEIGLAYDDTIADLWYIQAISKSMQGEIRAKVLPLVVKSLNEAEWVDYNRDAARILYADILSNTGQYTEAISILDANPFLYSADAEYIRAKSYYNMRDEVSVAKAREKIDASRRIYPLDTRFARLFFAHEYALEKDVLYEPDAELPPLVKKLANAFILQLPQYADADEALELYAAIFAEREKQLRMLNSFKARGLRAPLYAETALRAGLIDESEALDCFIAFADSVIDRAVFEAFVPLITENEIKKVLAEYLTAYDGTIIADTDGDLQPNLTVTYVRGRPQQILYDETQDGEYDWSCECDFGVPLTVHVADGALDIEYASWPYVQRALYQGVAQAPVLTCNLVGETLAWSPFSLQEMAVAQDALGISFFFPTVFSEAPTVSGRELLRASTSYELPSKERPGAVIRVSLLDGVSQIARYYTSAGTLYAQAHFEGGLPVLRTVDTDGDGLFETTETYGRVTGGAEQDVISVSDEMQIMTNLFGSPSSGTGFYVSMIQVDRNGDTIPDFTEEYQSGEGKISSWDTDGDGLWDVRYVKLPKQADGVVREEAYFHQPLTDSVVCVASENGEPVSVVDGEKTLSVTAFAGLYWLGEVGNKKLAENALSSLNQIDMQGVSVVIADEASRMLAVRIGAKIFGEILPSVADTEADE